MSPPIRDGSGNSIGSIRLGDGTEIAEVRTGAGDVVFGGGAILGSETNRFDFESGGAPAVDRIGNRDMSISGATFVKSPVQEGSFSLDFDGSNDSGDTGINQNTSNPFTVCLWVYPRAQSIDQHITGVWGGSADAQWQISTDGYEIFDGTNVSTVGISLQNNKWHFKAFVWDGSAFEPFAGDRTTSVSSQGSASGSIQSNTNTIRVGEEVGGSKHFNGVVDQWRRFGSALSQSELETVRQTDA